MDDEVNKYGENEKLLLVYYAKKPCKGEVSSLKTTDCSYVHCNLNNICTLMKLTDYSTMTQHLWSVQVYN